MECGTLPESTTAESTTTTAGGTTTTSGGITTVPGTTTAASTTTTAGDQEGTVPGIIGGRLATGPIRGRVEARIAAMVATTLPGTTRGQIICRRRTAERIRERWAARMQTAELRLRTATEDAKAWVRRAEAVPARRVVAVAAGLRRVVVVGLHRAAAAAGVRRVEEENGVDLL